MQGIQGEIKNIEISHRQDNAYTDSKFILSYLDDYANHVDKSPVSIKVVAEGVERYQVNNKRFKLEANTYLVVNDGDELDVHVKSSKITKGICLYPPNDLIKDVYTYRSQPEKTLLNNDCVTPGISFVSKRNDLKATSTGAFLKRTLPSFTKGAQHLAKIDFDNFYIALAEYLVNDQMQLDAQLMKLRANKKQTKEELYRRLSLAQEFIHDNFREKFDISELAKLACLSKYHFLRSFRDFYNCTPYQYVLKLKLAEAQILYSNGYSYAQIGELVGFSDPRNLRKALNSICE